MTDQVKIFTEAVKLMPEEVRKKRRRCMPPFRNLEFLATSEPQFDLCAPPPLPHRGPIKLVSKGNLLVKLVFYSKLFSFLFENTFDLGIAQNQRNTSTWQLFPSTYASANNVCAGKTNSLCPHLFK